MAIPEIIRGEDASFLIKLRKPNGDPYPINGWTKITVKFRKDSGGFYSVDTIPIAALTSVVLVQTVNFTADTPGDNGNSILLIFNGTDDIDTVVLAWNTANPTNTVSHDGVGTTILTANSAQLTGGRDGYTNVSPQTPEDCGFINILLVDLDTNELKTGKRQTIHLTIDKGAHPNGTRTKINIPDALNVENSP